jgi:16S rRNA (cytosine1402-N4)-methyltransferase
VTSTTHIPVMEAEVLTALNPVPNGRYADGTLGMGGHTAAILRRSAPTGWVFACDRDGAALRTAEQNLAEFTGRFELKRANYATLAEHLPAGSMDGVLLDLGVSSPQLDNADRGFSFLNDGPLDMRMDDRQKKTAADLVNTEDPEVLVRLLWEFGDEPRARRIVRVISERRLERPFETTSDLAATIESVCPRAGKRKHPATRTFQALRIAVNDEIGGLRQGLDGALNVLKPGGRLVVITFHSLEDRVVKAFGRALERDYEFDGDRDIPEFRRPCQPRLKRINRKAISPGPDELKVNPRSRSAQLRVFEKI